MEQSHGIRLSAILKKEKPTSISKELHPTGQLSLGYNLDSLEVAYPHALWTASLWSVIE